MKRIRMLVVSMIIMCLFSTGFTSASPEKKAVTSDKQIEQKTEEKAEDNNIIDKSFKKDFEMATATAEINYVAELYSKAWQAEFKSVATKIKKGYKYKEDQKRVDDYVTAYTSVAKKAFDLEMLNWSDISETPAKRNFGTGAGGAALLAEGMVYKQATLNLIQHYQGMSDGNEYKYSYNGKGAELQKLRQ